MVVTNRAPRRPGDLIGLYVGGYELVRLIGEGGMGAVYEAVNAALGKRAAVKVIAKDLAQRTDVVERFQREARTIAAIDDPNVVDIFDLNEIDGASCILMPLIGGVSLEELCRQMGPMPILEAFVIGVQIASGLDAVHAAGVVHRDIKPQNIMIERRQRRRYFVRIVDFGVAKILDARLAAGYRSRTMSVVGTIGYMAPEQAGGREVDARADVYALGVLLYRMLTARTPYEDDTLYGLIEKQVQQASFPRPRELRPEVPEIWDEAIMACLEVDRASRLGSAKELAHLLTRGIPHGEGMLRVLAPRLCIDTQLGPQGVTLTGDLDMSFERWSAVRPPVPPRSMSSARAAGLAVAGIAVGAVASLLLRSPSATPDRAHDSAPERSDIAMDTAPAPARQGGGSVPAPATDAGVSLDAIDAGERGARSGIEIDGGIATAAPATVVAPAPRPDVSTKGGAAAPTPALGERAPKAPLPGASKVSLAPAVEPSRRAPGESIPEPARPAPEAPPASAPVSQPGTIIVKVKPWAEVWIDDKPSGQTPVRKILSPGVHRVRIVGPNKSEELSVTVQAGRELTIPRSW